MNVIKVLRIYWRLRPVLSKLEEAGKMKFSVNALIQILGLVAQGINAASDLLPPRGKFWAAVGLSAVQGLIGVLAHFANPDGTPAEQPYQK